VLDRRARKHTGIAVAARTEDGVLTVARGSVTDSTIFEIGSITKVSTATPLADFARRGLVALDDPVQRYSPRTFGCRCAGGHHPARRRDPLGRAAGHAAGLLRRALRDRHDPWSSYTSADLIAAILGPDLVKQLV
jgi:CubicO group peptidase (beta-lactamase class C family)